MTPRQCRYQCGTMLDAWDDDAKKYREAGSGGLHTKERCEEMKAKARQQQGEKNNHGNEVIPTSKPLSLQPIINEYVDHTQGPKLKLKVLTSTEAEGLGIAYNNFGENHKIQFSQYHPVNALYTIAVWYSDA